MLILENVALADLETATLRPGCHVALEGELIREVSDRPIRSGTAERLDLGGRCLLPGLIDAHFHAMLASNPSQARDVPQTLCTARAAKLLHESLLRGFTTVRDMGGADWGLRAAIAEGTVQGPRLFIAGRALSQTGGHGDLRSRTESHEPCSCSNSLALMSVVADGKDAVQAATREQLRQGVDHVKVFVSGGVASPNDPLTSVQYTDEELAAIVREARHWGVYVAAHAYTAASITRAVGVGIRTIEHGNLLDESAARAMAERGAFLVPTLIIYQALTRRGPALGLTAEMSSKLKTVLEAGFASVEMALKAGVRIGFGTDLLGEMHEHQSEELELRANVQRPADVIAAATRINAEILGMVGKLGVIAPDAFADLIALEGNPLEDISLLRSERLDLIVKGGRMIHRRL